MAGQSLLSEATTKSLSEEISDSNSSSPHQFPINGVFSSSSKFKGVVSQVNGNWGVQIYANHQRIWLGTFKSESEAAMAYDSAAIKLHNGRTHRNFPWTNITVQEPNFQSQFSTDAVLGMIKDGSYTARFTDFLRTQDRQGRNFPSAVPSSPPSGIGLKQLFQKELTPSDVGKLNRLVIPKRYAVKYFPRISDANGKCNQDSYDLELVFFDRLMRSWKFRYCYWKSSQSFVFTRGWNGFAKEKGLKPRDRVIFSSYEYCDKKICLIDVAYKDCDGGHGEAINSDSNGNFEVERMEIEQKVGDTGGDVKEVDDRGMGNGAGFKLFGVRIG